MLEKKETEGVDIVETFETSNEIDPGLNWLSIIWKM